jgi:two-component system nitrate/nitrite response regulator NarL
MQQLSAREKTILRCIIEGCSNKAIARKVAISEATVKVHVKSILRKFRVHSRTQAAIWGMSCSASQWEIDDVAALNQITAQASAPQHAMPALPQAVGGETAMSRF